MAEQDHDSTKSDIISGFKSKIHYGIPAKSSHTRSIIFLHGLGDVGGTWIEYFESISRDDINYIFPTAPSMSVTVNGGHVMPSWFDTIQLVEYPKKENNEDILKACAFLESVIVEETKKGIPTERIILGGISQGGATTLITALSTKFKLGGVILLNTYIVLREEIPKLLSGVNKHTPVFHAHGVKDKLITMDWCNNTHKKLEELFDNIEYKIYEDLGHWVCIEEFKDIGLWVDKVLPS